MPLQIKLGATGWDAVGYVRGLIEDTVQPYIIPDSTFQSYAEDVNEDFSRHIPLDYLVGNIYGNSSPVVTVSGQQRYVGNVANGFPVPAMTITDILYSAGQGYSAASEIAYLALVPFSPITRFLASNNLLDSPSERILRDSYIEELQHYGHGYYSVVRDTATGLLSVDLFPIPTISGTPIYVRYSGAHNMVSSVDGSGNQILTIATVPDNHKRDWAKLLYALVLEEEGGRIIKTKEAKSGLVEVAMDPRMIEQKIVRIKQEVTGSMGGFVGVIMAS